ncbi:hypothetical protein ACNOWC_000623, partial [Yersinia enterocolitica]
ASITGRHSPVGGVPCTITRPAKWKTSLIIAVLSFTPLSCLINPLQKKYSISSYGSHQTYHQAISEPLEAE